MENFLSRLNRNPYQPIDGASVTKFDELGNGLDDWGNVIAPRFEAPEQTWGETALGVLTAPQRLAGALYDSLTPYQFSQTTSTPMNRAGAGQPITGGSGDGGWQVPPVAQEGWNALTAVGDAYNYGMTDDEINSRALGMAGFMMGGGGLAAKPTLKAAAAPAPRAAAAQSSLRLLLDEAGDSLPSKAPWESPQRYAYEIQSGAGDDIGWLSMALDPTGKTAFVDHVAMSNRDAGGLKGSRDLFRTIKQQHPDLESIYGYRMRNGEATPDDKMQMFDLTRLHSNASKEGAVPAILAYRGKQEASTLFPEGATDIWASSSPQIASTYTRLGPEGEHWLDALPASERAMFDSEDFGGQAIAPVAMDFRSPLTLDAGGSMWSEIPFEGRAVSSDELASIARSRGHDGLVINNVLDEAPGFEGDLTVPSTTYAALQRGTVRSPLTGETLYSNASKEGAVPAIAGALENRWSPESIAERMRQKMADHPPPQKPVTIDDDPDWMSKALARDQDEYKQAILNFEKTIQPSTASEYGRTHNAARKVEAYSDQDPETLANALLRSGIKSYWDRHQIAIVDPSVARILPSDNPAHLGPDEMMSYHGTPGKAFSTIDPSKFQQRASHDTAEGIGRGFFTTQDPYNAYSYSRYKKADGTILPVAVSKDGMTHWRDPKYWDAIQRLPPIVDRNTGETFFSNADSKPALLAGALGQEQDVPDWLLPFLHGM